MTIDLRKLAEQAGFDLVDIRDQFDYNDVSPIKEFTRLIVKECVELSVNSQYVNTKSEYYEGFNEALIYAGNKIKKHFGVEE